MISLRKIAIALALLTAICAHATTELLAPGFRPVPNDAHALVGATVFVKPGQIISNATVVLRAGKIEKVGANIAVPPDARVWNLKGMNIYAGFIDPYLTFSATGSPDSGSKKDRNDLTAGVKFFGVPGAERDPGNPGPGSELPAITPERRMAKTFAPEAKSLESLRELGFTTANVVPEKNIIRGTSVFVALGETDPNRAIIRSDVMQNVGFEEGFKEDTYPESLMGVVAAVRQTFFDAQHALVAPNENPREFNPALEALAPAVKKQMRVAFEPRSALMVDRAARVAREIGLDFCIVSSGQEWRRPDLAKAAAVPFIVPLNFPEVPKLPDDDDWTQVSLDQLRAWDWAPENPALLRKQNLEVALTTFGLEDKKAFRKNLKLALQRGLTESDALAALTTVPAKLCGLDKEVGTIETGKLANLTIVNGKGYFEPESKVQSVWIDGRFYRTDFEEPKPESKDDHTASSGEKKEEATKPSPAPPKVVEPEKQPAPEPTEAEKVAAKKPKKSAEAKAETSDKDKAKDKKAEPPKPRVARSPLDGRGALTAPTLVIITNATIWTCGSQGILTNASIAISNDKIQGVNSPVTFHGKATFIDGTGLHVTPGLIDCHSHSMILGDVNEGTIPSTAMVRIGDVVNSETANIYEQLGGGLTACNLLHGSANPIGGQNCVIKLRDGASPEGLKFAAAPQGIKFALGENVKQSNWGEKYKTRFPQTRMGVETFIANRFIAAQRYLKEWEHYEALATADYPRSNKPLQLPSAPRRDLELEAIGEILQGKRLIHCHSYRQDEILMLLRLMQGFGVQIATFQHVLEGYKIAEEIAAGKVGGSTFADWWAYKFEVYDAIPYNGSLMHDRGVVVSFNSDSSDLARHLNLEAAKAVKYGGTSEVEALKFVTLNPAKQLRIDKYVGSLEPGKDADFVIWNKNPLDSSSLCLQTWIDGKKYFDRDQSKARFAALETERQALIEKAKKSGKADSAKDSSAEAKKKFFEVSLEHRYDGKIRHCEEDEQ